MKRLLPVLLTLALAACSTAPKKPAPPSAGHGRKPAPAATTPGREVARANKDCSFYAPAQEDPATRGNYTAGGLYAPGVADTTPDHIPDLDCIAEPQVVDLPRSAVGNRSPYTVLGKKYQVMDDVEGYAETGTASYYGNKFHGRLTSNREVYDMYAFSAAHKTLPLPSFARVTNLDNGQSVIVRVNDRGPFHDGRVIDLSYAAAVKLGITQRGTGRVEVRALTPALMAREGKGKPAPARAEVTALPNTAAAAPSAMDRMVDQLPARSSKPASLSAATAARASAPRYHVEPDAGQAPSADDFDAWMKANGMRVATGKPGVPEPRAGSPKVATTAPAAATTRAATAVATASAATPSSAGWQQEFGVGASGPAPSATPARPNTATAVRTGEALQLQVASFASRENADKALARLTAAGIDGASLSDVRSQGRVLWRLRVGAPDAARADELAGRIASLGFGRPQLVRE